MLNIYIMLKKEYNCFRCGYKSKKCNVQHHFRRTTACKREITCPYTDEEIKILNERQFIKEDYKKIKDGKISEIINIENQTINNIQNQNNITNNHITINIDKIVGFNDEWNIEGMSEKHRTNLLITNVMYTQLLTIILENEFNKNVIIQNKESTHGLIFKKINNEKQYQEISIDEIINESMIKLHKQLFTIYDSHLSTNYNNDKSFEEHVLKQKNLTSQKFNEFLNDKKIKNTVKDVIQKIYIENKDDAILNQQIIMENKDNFNGY